LLPGKIVFSTKIFRGLYGGGGCRTPKNFQKNGARKKFKLNPHKWAHLVQENLRRPTKKFPGYGQVRPLLVIRLTKNCGFPRKFFLASLHSRGGANFAATSVCVWGGGVGILYLPWFFSGSSKTKTQHFFGGGGGGGGGGVGPSCSTGGGGPFLFYSPFQKHWSLPPNET